MMIVLVVFSSVPGCVLIIIIMYIYHALINTLSIHMIHIYINLNILYTYVEHSPTKTIYIKYYTEKQIHTLTQTAMNSNVYVSGDVES